MYYADLHIHSKYSRATSKELNPESLFRWAQLKRVQVVGSGDCTHPGWLKELKKKIEPSGDGLFKLKNDIAEAVQKDVPAACEGEVRFILSGEVSSIYKKNDKVRKVHNVVFLSSFEAAERFQSRLGKIGNIVSDGRPILGLDARDLLEVLLETDEEGFLVPAHIWTPWFSVLGSKGGFDSVQECFGDLTGHIFAVETGLSSDPLMNWRLSQLDRFVMISNSDAHSPQKLGREATIFDGTISYQAIYRALKEATPELLGTVEFYPEEGKYHYDGHRQCQSRLHPKETIENKGLCPVCGKPVTVGVMARVEELADHPEGRKSPKARPYYSLVPLPEIIAEARGVGAGSKKVDSDLFEMFSKLGNELFILRELPLKEIEKTCGTLVAEGVRRVREGNLQIAAGYDGEYGTIHIFSDEERATAKEQMTLF